MAQLQTAQARRARPRAPLRFGPCGSCHVCSAPSADSAWQAAMTLSALWHTFQGRYMPTAAGALSADAEDAELTQVGTLAAKHAFFDADGPSCCISLLAGGPRLPLRSASLCGMQVSAAVPLTALGAAFDDASTSRPLADVLEDGGGAKVAVRIRVRPEHAGVSCAVSTAVLKSAQAPSTAPSDERMRAVRRVRLRTPARLRHASAV